jgi:DNA primase
MPGFLGEDQVRMVKSRIDLVQLMGEYTPLRKSGANFSGCCAFHQERTPSMYVYPEQQTYHCFGCGAHGDAITLVREKERVDFSDAIELLARRAGITLTYRDDAGRAPKGEREAQLAAVEFAVKYYEHVLWERPEAAEARAYLQSRALSEAACRRFRLGWAPGNGQLVDEARRKGIAARALLDVDLAVDRNGRPADRFWERVMFPICDRFGAPIAFSGRLLPAAERKAKEEGRGVGKYINNTDTPLYHKGNAVFNLHRARTASRDQGRLIVMEGPTDVMAADEAGFTECVAVLGTALTPEHARQLGSLVGTAGRLLILLDGDRAGQANSIKAVRTCLSVGVPVRVCVLPDELDPAELLADPAQRERGRAVMEQVLASGRADVDHLLRALAPRPYELDNRALVAVTDQVLEALRPMPDPELRALHLRDAAEYLGIERSRLERRLNGADAKAAESAATAAVRAEERAASEAAGSGVAPARPPVPIAELVPAAELALHLLLRHPALRAGAADDLGLEPSHFPAPWDELAGVLLHDPAADIHVLADLAAVRDHPQVHARAYGWASLDTAARVPAVAEPAQDLADAVRELRRRHLKDQVHRLALEIADAERARDFATVGRLSNEKLALTRSLKDLAGQSQSERPLGSGHPDAK